MDTGTADLAPAPGLRVDYADLIGKPFEWGARGPNSFDCYGLVTEVLRRAGQEIPDYLHPRVQEEIAAMVETHSSHWVPCVEGPGAVVSIRIGRLVSHVGIVLPYGRLLHCWERSGGVVVERMDEWKRRIVGYYRFPK